MQLEDLAVDGEYLRAGEAEAVGGGSAGQGVCQETCAGGPDNAAANPSSEPSDNLQAWRKMPTGIGFGKDIVRPPRARGLELLADEMDGNGAGVRGAAMLPEVNALPGAQRQLAVADGNGKIDRRKGGAHVSGHVVVAFDRVREERIAVRHKASEEMLQVTPHVRVGVFLDQQGGGSVAEVQSHQAGGETVLGNPVRHFAGEFVEAAAARGNPYLMKKPGATSDLQSLESKV